MSERRHPPYSKGFSLARAQGLVPRLLTGVHLVVTLSWDECRTGAVPRVVIPDDPAGYYLRFVAGLDVRVVFTARDADRVAGVVDALLAAGAASVETVHHDLREAGAPRDSWLGYFALGVSHAS